MSIIHDQEPLFTEREVLEAQSCEQLVAMETDLRAIISKAIAQTALIHDVLDGNGYTRLNSDNVIHLSRKVET